MLITESKGSFQPGRLVLADGTTFEGRVFGAPRTAVGEVVFTTGMTGYQEVITDPSYAEQLVVMTATHIGNVGANADDDESEKPYLGGLILHRYSPQVSNWRADETLGAYLHRHHVPAIEAIDTRALTQHIRDKGAQAAAFGTESAPALRDVAKSAPSLVGRNLTERVACKEQRVLRSTQGGGSVRAKVVAVDYGMKFNMLRCLTDLGCEVTVVPPSSSKEDVLGLDPDGVFLSNGPGDPAAVENAVRVTRDLLGKVPIFGICLGHQVLSLAAGASTYKLKFGHRGLNQPVKDTRNGRIHVTTQNHGFCVDGKTLPKSCVETHVHLNDGTCEGIDIAEANAFSVQHHPEASAGPHDALSLFAEFVQRIEEHRH